MWNFQNGHHIVHCEPASDSEVTGLISVGKKKGILAVGWSRMVTFYDDSDAELVSCYAIYTQGNFHVRSDRSDIIG